MSMLWPNKDRRVRNLIINVDLDIRQKDIDEGFAAARDACPIHRVVTRAIKARFRRWEIVKADVGNNFVHLFVKTPAGGDEQYEFLAQIPGRATAFVYALDREEPVTPGNYGSLEFLYNCTPVIY
jgi:hypothetical protein